ncbi:MAG: HEAT repeat domain-containing protein [Deltaproteobacteria bacterium]|nr:HEAT repeat domain-containing protein [Deltaproteobacteria bacterium]
MRSCPPPTLHRPSIHRRPVLCTAVRAIALLGVFSPVLASAQQERGLQVLHQLERLRDSDNWRTRMQAAVYISGSRDVRARRALGRALDDTHYAVRAACVRGLASIGDARDVAAVVDRLADPESYVSMEARRALERWPIDTIEDTLIRLLKTHPDSQVRRTIAERLAERVTPAVADALLEAMADADEAGRFAGSVLGALPDATARRVFLRGLQMPSYRVQAAAIDALGHLDDPSVVEPIARLIGARSPEVSRAAARSLARLRKHIDAKTYLMVARRSRDRRARAHALRIAGVVGGEEASSAIFFAMDDKDITVRGAAVAALVDLRDPRAIPKLKEMKGRRENARIIALIRSTMAHLARLQRAAAES